MLWVIFAATKFEIMGISMWGDERVIACNIAFTIWATS